MHNGIFKLKNMTIDQLTHIISESIKKALILELSSNRFVKLGKNYVKSLHPEMNDGEVYRDFLRLLNSAVPSGTNALGNCCGGKFILGVLRLYHTDKNYDPQLMERIINKLSVEDSELFNEDLNGLKTVNDVAKQLGFAQKVSNKNDIKPIENLDYNLNRISAGEDGKSVKIGRYTIYNCFTYDTVEKFIRLESKNRICFTNNMKSFYKDEGRYGRFPKYACVRDDYYRVNELNITDRYPYDDYGLSLIYVTVGDNGELLEVCSRWNNGVHMKTIITPSGKLTEFGEYLKNSGLYDTVVNRMKAMQSSGFHIASEYLNETQIEEVVLGGLIKFKDVFRPFTKDSIVLRRNNIDRLKKLCYDAQQNGNSHEYFKQFRDELNSVYGK